MRCRRRCIAQSDWHGAPLLARVRHHGRGCVCAGHPARRPVPADDIITAPHTPQQHGHSHAGRRRAADALADRPCALLWVRGMSCGRAVTWGRFLLDSAMFAPVGYWMDRYGRKSTGVPAFAILSAQPMHAAPAAHTSQIGLFFLPDAGTFVMLSAMSVVCGLGNGLSTGLNMVRAAMRTAPIHPAARSWAPTSRRQLRMRASSSVWWCYAPGEEHVRQACGR